MKSFITKTLLFSFFSAIFIAVLFCSTQLIINKNADFKLKRPIDNVIFGHSHPTYAFNDSLINNFKNLAQSRQAYLYSFIKIKNVISQNPSIKTIFLEFTNNQITKEMDDWLWDNMTISSKLPKYLPFLQKEDINLLYEKNSKAFLAGSSKTFRENILNLINFKFDYTNQIGGYKWTSRNDTDSILSLNNIKNHKLIDNLSLDNLNYLDKIIAFCAQKNINIYLIRSPQHKKYKGRLNEHLFIQLKNDRYKNIEFLDFNNFPLKNSEFADLDHLNQIGASKFSKWFNELNEKGLLQKKNKQIFIESELKKLK